MMAVTLAACAIAVAVLGFAAARGRRRRDTADRFSQRELFKYKS